MGTLRTSNKTLEYQLRVAIEYGDTLRADEIRAKMGENNADIEGLGLDKTAALLAESQAQDAATRSLTANTAGGRANREMVLALVQAYQKQIQTLAASGLSTAELTRRTDELEREFFSQMIQMGYNRAEVDRYSQSFRDISAVIAKVPRNVTVTADANPAQQAINEFLDRNRNNSLTTGTRADTGGAQNDLNNFLNNNRGINVPISTSFDSSGAVRAAAASNLVAQIAAAQKAYETALRSGADNTTQRALDRLNALTANLRNGNYASGGFTGRGGKYEEAGVVHKGEYVVPQEGVDQSTGLPYQSYMANMLPSSSVTSTVNNYSQRGASNPIQLVELLPTQLAQLADSLSVNIGLDGAALAQAVNGKNQQSSTRRTT